MTDGWDMATFALNRFVEAQEGVYDRVLAELRAGHKSTHWMWFIFPQIEGLGTSFTARKFAIASLEEARAYLAHPVLGPRIRECTAAVNAVSGRSSDQIFGYIDDLKFRSSLTLFAHATTDNHVFAEALRKYYGGEYDPLTLERIGSAR